MKSGKELLNSPSWKKSMFKFIRGPKEEKEDYGTLSRKDQLKEEKDLSKLSSFETIKAKTFYRIQNELSLIAKSQENLINLSLEEQESEVNLLNKRLIEAMNLLGEANLKIQHQRWTEISETYYREVDEHDFELFINKLRKSVKWDCELVEMRAAYALASIGQESGWNALRQMGLTGTLDKIAQKINGKITNHELKQKTYTENNQIDFFVTLALIKKRDYKADSNILLQEWVGILKSIKEENERNDTKK